MATVDSNGIIRVEDSDNVSPLHPVLNSIASSVSARFDDDVQFHRVDNLTQRNALVGSPLPSNDNPLFVWRKNAGAGRQFEYSVNGTDWYSFVTSEDPQVRKGSEVLPWYRTGHLGPYVEGAVVDLQRAGMNVSLTATASPGTTLSVNAVNSSGAEQYNKLCDIPAEHRPPWNIVFVSQGSGSNRASVLLTEDGEVYVNRYGPGTATTNTWLPVNISWIASI